MLRNTNLHRHEENMTRNVELDNSEKDINDKLEKYNPAFYLIGNTLLRNSELNINLRNVDKLIFDSRFYKSFDVVKIVKEIKSEKRLKLKHQLILYSQLKCKLLLELKKFI